MRVFISSTSDDLRPYRAAARDVVLDLGGQPVMMEHFGTDSHRRVVEACQHKLDEADVVLAILAWKRGGVPGPERGGDGRRSYTQLEIDTALERGEPVLVLMADEKWPGSLWEDDADARAQVHDVRGELDRLAVFFAWEPVEEASREPLPVFRAKVRQELTRFQLEARADEASGSRSAAHDRFTVELEEAYETKAKLEADGQDTAHLDGKILEIQRQIREGGQLKPGDFLLDGRFKLVEPVGQGGFARVWKAHDRPRRSKIVAVKVLHPQYAEDRTRRERFFRGAHQMARLEHPGIVRVLEEKCHDGGFYFFVMDYLGGGDLRRAVLEGRLGPDEGLRIVAEVGEALAFAHDSGVIHRDVKPGNILLTPQGRAKLTDFDLVRAADTTGGTRTGMMGTFVYASPEMMERAPEATAAADVFGLGMTAIFVLHGKDLPSIVLRHPERVLGELDVSEACREVLGRAVSWEPEDRPPSVEVFCRELREPPARSMEARLREKIERLRPWWPKTWKTEIVREVLAQFRGREFAAKDLEEAAHDVLIDELRKRRGDDVTCLRQQFEKLMARLLPSWQKELREDLVQDTVIRVLMSMDRHGDHRELYWGLLWRVARSVVSDKLGKKEQTEVPIDEIGAAEPVPDQDPVAAGELRVAIHECLGGLTPDERRVMELSLLDEAMKPREIAAILGVAPKQLDNRLNRGRKKLRDCLEAKGYHRSSRRKRRS